jgi:hypothetical protein
MALAASSVPGGYVAIFVPYYFHRGLGRRIYARSYGLKAFRLVVPIRKK